MQEWERKLNDDRTLLLKQSGQVEKVESTLGKIQNTQSTLAGIMEKIQNHIWQNADQDETSVNETPTTSEPLPPPLGPSEECVVLKGPVGSAFWENLEKQLRSMSERYPEGLPLEP